MKKERYYKKEYIINLLSVNIFWSQYLQHPAFNMLFNTSIFTSWVYVEGRRGGPWLSSKFLERKIHVSLCLKQKKLNKKIKEVYRSEKKKIVLQLCS